MAKNPIKATGTKKGVLKYKGSKRKRIAIEIFDPFFKIFESALITYAKIPRTKSFTLLGSNKCTVNNYFN
jgi:hypothetical protein